VCVCVYIYVYDMCIHDIQRQETECKAGG
jgi:hypothetical protein